MDKNLDLLKEILSFIEVDLSQEAAENLLEVPDNETELKSISFKNINVGKPDKEFLKKHALKDREFSPDSNKQNFKREKNNEFDSFREEQKPEVENGDDVNFIEIPTVTKPKILNMMDRMTRCNLYQKQYHKRRMMKNEGKWNPVLTDKSFQGFRNPNKKLNFSGNKNELKFTWKFYTEVTQPENKGFRLEIDTPEEEKDGGIVPSALTDQQPGSNFNIFSSKSI